MSNKLGGTDFDIPAGTRDAFHVPVIAAMCDERVRGGEWVRFVDDSATKVERCEQHESHGISDPFNSDIRPNDPFYVLLCPGLVDSVRHTFEVSFIGKSALEIALEKQRAEDPECAECWQIENGRLVRW